MENAKAGDETAVALSEQDLAQMIAAAASEPGGSGDSRRALLAEIVRLRGEVARLERAAP